MTPDELRTTIPALDDVTYLNTGAHGPSPRPIVERATEFLEYHEYESPGDDGPYPTAFDAYEAVREDVAAFIGAETEEVALTQSTTDGINRIATALDWEPGDVVVRTDLEHPAASSRGGDSNARGSKSASSRARQGGSIWTSTPRPSATPTSSVSAP